MKSKRIDGSCQYSDVWEFNFYTPLFEGAEEKKQIVLVCKEHNIYCHKQIPVFHSPFFASEDYDEKPHAPWFDMNYFLQFAHGVRSEIPCYYQKNVFSLAKEYQFRNVTQLIEQQLIMRDYPMDFESIIVYDLNHQLAMRLRKLKSSEELTSILRKRNIEKMSGEAMKQCVKFFMEH
uniref:BTB domain-containing protein n=1 Tax=Caenorhabditis tropicalis TaxID=1561998 RepID=A0A1I7UKR1_9PELO